MDKQAILPSSPWARIDCSELGTSEMVQRWRDHFSHPPLFNDLGCFRVGPDPMAIHNFMFPPFSGMGEGTAMLYLNRRHSAACDVEVGYTWYPDRVVRRCRFEGFEVETCTRALPKSPGGLIRLRITNPAPEARGVEVGIKLAGRLLHTIEGWAGIGPAIGIEDEQSEGWHFRDRDGAMVFHSAESACQCQGVRPMPDAVEGKTFIHQVRIEGGESWELDFVATLAESEERAVAMFREVMADLDGAARESHEAWNGKIQKAFQPDNGLFSGHLPTVHTEHDELKRLFLMTTLGCLALRRDNPISSYGPAFVTLSPNYWTTASFLWDMMIAAPFYAMLDPALLRNHIEVWLGADIRHCLATDYVTGRPLGNWYAVNSSAIVRLSHDYLRYTGDLDWLDTRVDGRPIIDHLEEHALMWHSYDHHGHGLADCGGVINLLECVSTYTHAVASFNAMWVAALRQVAAMRRLRGEMADAKRLEADAESLLGRVLSLYADGKGYWRCRQPDGSHHDVHHIYDFVAVLESISDDLPPKVQQEMVANFLAQHQTSNWTRSLSAWDDDAHRAVRVDHQWTGSFASISAQAINGLCRVGEGRRAFEWLRSVANVAHQGPIGQAHWAAPLFPSFEGGAWKCSYLPPFITDWTVAANGAYPAMIVESIFGFQPTLEDGLQWKGLVEGLDSGARLENVPFQGKNHAVDRDGITSME